MLHNTSPSPAVPVNSVTFSDFSLEETDDTYFLRSSIEYCLLFIFCCFLIFSFPQLSRWFIYPFCRSVCTTGVYIVTCLMERGS